MQNTETAAHPKLAKIRKMLNLAEDPGATEAEAAAFTEKASAMIAQYGLEKALAEHADVDPTKIEQRVREFQAPYARDRATLAYAVAVALGCQGVLSPQVIRGRKVDMLHLFGTAADLERASMLYTSLLLQGGRDLSRTPLHPGQNKAAFIRSWWSGFTVTVSDRIDAAERAARTDAEGDFVAAGTSTAIVLRSKRAETGAAVREAFPSTRPGSRRLSGGGHASGTAAGNRANLGGGGTIGSRRALGS